MKVLIQIHESNICLVVSQDMIDQMEAENKSSHSKGHSVELNGETIGWNEGWEVIMNLPSDSEAEITPGVVLVDVH